MVSRIRGERSGVRWRPRFGSPLAVVIVLAGAIVARGVSGQDHEGSDRPSSSVPDEKKTENRETTEFEGPECLRNPYFWTDHLVVQTRGWVLALGDDDNIIREEYWKLSPAAVGRVTAVQPDGTVIVEFDSDVGWQRCGFEEHEVRSQRWEPEVDQYGQPIGVRMTESIREGVQVEPGDHGHRLDDGAGRGRRTVRFPLNCLGLAPPPPGTKVVPGPDMHESERRRLPEDAVGTVMTFPDKEHVIKVQWDDTKREKFYRYDCRRHYDVLPVTSEVENRPSR